MPEKLRNAFEMFDRANAKDPTTEKVEGKIFPKELLYAQRMSKRLAGFAPTASDALKLAARCQHICRWEIPRSTYGMNREGYLKWRKDLKRFHVEKASAILEKVGYDEATVKKFSFLLEKKQLKRNEETQILEDVICLVFLEYYFEPFALKHPEGKTMDIIQKTWRKMSKKGQETALGLPLSKSSLSIILKAIDS